MVSNQFKGINYYLSAMPSALSGLALAIASLGLCWENVAKLQGVGQMSSAIVASCILVPLFLKFIFNPHLLQQDLQHPIGGSLIPTLAMAVMVVANNIAWYSLLLGQIISWFAIILHLCFLSYFIFYRSCNFKFKHILPSWFIPPIGLVLALIMYPGGLPPIFAELILELGLFSYALLLPVILYRLLFSEKLLENEKPIIAILATPASLLLVGYFTIVADPSYLMVTVLIALALLMTLFVYFAFIKLLRLPFTPAYAAFTFPLVVGAIALFKTSQFLSAEGFDIRLIKLAEQLASIELMIATAMVSYVIFRYLRHFYHIFEKSPKQLND